MSSHMLDSRMGWGLKGASHYHYLSSQMLNSCRIVVDIENYISNEDMRMYRRSAFERHLPSF